nr:hypothetical protein [Nonomuraea cypriaca]
MQVLYQRCAAIDVGKDEIAIAVRTPGDGPQGRVTIKRTYKTFYSVHKEAARRLHLQHLDLLDQMIAKLDAQVEEMMVPFRLARELLTSIPGIGPMAAAQVIGETSPARGSSSPPPPSWPPGRDWLRVTTSRRANASPDDAATATSTCNRSWSRPPGPRCDIPATCARSTTGT